MKFELREINYLTDPTQHYADGLGKVKSLAELQAFAEEWKAIAKDAFDTIMKMNQQDFEEFIEGLKLERRGKFAGEQYAIRYAVLMMPSVLFVVGMHALDLHAPWGTVYKRMLEQGMIIERNGIAYLKEKK